jgi:hypothetical protein
MPAFELHSDFKPTGDQPQAIEQLVAGLGLVAGGFEVGVKFKGRHRWQGGG